MIGLGLLVGNSLVASTKLINARPG